MSRRAWAALAGVCVLGALITVSWLLATNTVAPLVGSADDETARNSSIAGSPASAELVEHPRRWDGKRITFTGEAVGHVMLRGDHAWIHVNDDSYARKSAVAGGRLSGYNSGQAIWAPARLASAITICGDYKHQGDIVRVDAVFHAACGQHGGDMDIHAAALTVEQAGRTIAHPINGIKVAALIPLAALVLILFWLVRGHLLSGSSSRSSARPPRAGSRT